MKPRTITAMLLALLLPGAGHFYLGRRRRAAVFCVIVVLMFVIGVSIDGRLYVPENGSILSLLATIGSLGVGLPYAVAKMMGFRGDITSITFEYGTAFMLTAGLMNLLLVLDSFDISEGRKE